ncbi:cyclin-C1-2-like protein isoform X1 [Tanacetum coccineum]
MTLICSLDIARLAQNVKVRQRRSMTEYDPRLLAPSCLYLAAKSEESTVQARLLVFYIKKIYPDERYRCEIKEILEMEMKILEALNYYLVVFHPYCSLPQLLHDAGMSDATQLTWGIVNDTYRMDLVLIHPPYLIGLACIYVASVLNEKDNTAWFEDLRVDMNVVKNIAMEILDFYDKQRTISDERMNAAMHKLGDIKSPNPRGSIPIGDEDEDVKRFPDGDGGEDGDGVEKRRWG